jgi:hypothetical protein
VAVAAELFRSAAEGEAWVVPLPATVTVADLIAFADGWAALIEREDYAAEYAYTDHIPEMRCTPEFMRQVVKSYGDAREDQRVTFAGVPRDVSQHKQGDRWDANRYGEVGEIGYDLNIDGVASDLSATF